MIEGINLKKRFDQVVELYGKAECLRYEDQSFTYNEINLYSNQLANYIDQEYRLTPQEVVVIFNNKTVYGFSSMLACIKLGLIYVNLDITSPIERLEKIIIRCAPSLLINDFTENSSFIEPFEDSDFSSLNIHDPLVANKLKNKSGKLENEVIIPDHFITYIMFTSGSTGFPKGAAMTHANLMSLIEWSRATYDITTNDVFTNVNPLYFDNSVFDFFASLFNAATLAPFSYETLKDPNAIVKYANSVKPTIWFSVPSMLVYLLTTKALSEKDLTTLRVFTFGGEGFPKPKLKKLYELFGDRVELINVYGPTECTCICSSYKISEKDFEDMVSLASLGKIAPNFSAVLLDAKDGGFELGLSGTQIGVGYYNDKERTEKSFIQNPHNRLFREIIYKTGDLVSIDDQGYLFFNGRVDNQIKHMGYRIELEEIESIVNNISGVNECGVIYKKLSIGGHIISYVAGESNLNKEYLLQELRNLLPPYMIPKIIRIVDVLPKNRNGKIDRVELKKLEL